MSVDVVIVNWNSGSLIVDCLNSLLDCGDEISNIILVDNASTDGSYELIVKNYRNVIFVSNKKNFGFAKACNIGAALAQNEYILFLNPDTKVFRGSISKSLFFMQQPENYSIGAVGIKLRDGTGKVARSSCRFPAISSLVCHSVGLDRLLPRTGYLMNDWDHMDSRNVDHVIGAFYLIRRRIFEKLNGFDERFFVYLEDLDLSLRIRNLGYKVFYLSEAEAYHVGGGTSSRVKALRLFYSLRSRLIYANKHFPPLGRVPIFAATLFVEPFIRIFSSALNLKFLESVEAIKGFWNLYRWMPSLFKKNNESL